jgi:hypothetical protein
MHHGTANGGIQSPTTTPREAEVKCCAKCRRGMPGSLGPCGYDLGCHCHDAHNVRCLSDVLDQMETK